MSEKQATANIFDPHSMMKGMRDASMENWSKIMIELVNSDVFAATNVGMLNTLLSSSLPFRKAMETAVNQSLSAMNIASRDDYIRLANQLTNIEMRLDDLDAKLDASMRQQGTPPSRLKAGRHERIE